MMTEEVSENSRREGHGGFAHVRSKEAQTGCWIFYVVSQKGAGPYDFFLTSERGEPANRNLHYPSYSPG